MNGMTYRVMVDWGRTGLFDHALSNISAYVSGIQCAWGIQTPGENFAQPSSAQVTLTDRYRDFVIGDFLAGAFSQLLRKGTLIKIEVIYPGSYPLYIGKIEDVRYPPGNEKDAPVEGHTVTLVCTDPMLQFLDAEYFPKLYEDIATGDALKVLFDDAVVMWPYPPFILDASVLDGPDTLYENTMTNFAQGRTVIPAWGDNSDSGQGVSAQGEARKIVAAELGGRFFWDGPTGKMVYTDRLNDLLIGPVQQIQAEEISSVTPVYGPNLTNSVTLTYSTFTIDDGISVLYEHPSLPMRLAPGEERTITGRYTGSEHERVGAKSIEPAQMHTDYAASKLEQGKRPERGEDLTNVGEDVTARVGCFFEYGSASCKLTVKNPNAFEVYIYKLQVRGVGIRSTTRNTVTETDPASVHKYGRYDTPVTLELVRDDEFAISAARWLAYKSSDPGLFWNACQFTVTADFNFARLFVNAGDKVTLQRFNSEGNLQYYDSDHIVIGISHAIDPREGRHVLGWVVEAVERLNLFILDSSLLDGNDVLAL